MSRLGAGVVSGLMGVGGAAVGSVVAYAQTNPTPGYISDQGEVLLLKGAGIGALAGAVLGAVIGAGPDAPKQVGVGDMRLNSNPRFP